MAAQTPPTLYDVAREAGVSLATASRVLNGSSRKVQDGYRDLVTAAAEKLGYTANVPAQAMARGMSATIGLLVSDIDDPYFSAIASGAIAAAEERGHVVTISVTGRDPGRELRLVRALRGQRARAIVLAGSRTIDAEDEDALIAELQSYASSGGSVVLVSQHRLPFPTVVLDGAGGAAALAEALLDLGYRGFAVLAGPEQLATARDRVEGFVAALAARGVTPRAVVHGQFGRDGGFAAAAELDVQGVDVVWAVNDVMAIGAMAALRDRGVRVPEQVAVAGFDDIPTAADMAPPLTTVSLPLGPAGAAAIELAFGEEADAEVPLGSHVVLRASTPGR